MTNLQELHDRATRGLALTTAEQIQLDNWYAEQDEAEYSLFASAATTQNVAGLQAQIKAGLAQVVVVTQRIQDLMRQNEELQREVTSLKNQLTQRLTAQTV